MRTQRTIRGGMTRALIALLVTPVLAVGQAVCSDGREPIPTIGVGTFHCQGGTCRVRGAVATSASSGGAGTSQGVGVSGSGRSSESLFDFSVQPGLWNIDPAGPAAGVLEDGDQLLSVDGASITSAEGGRILSEMDSSRAITLQVRRGPRIVTAELRPEMTCRGISVSVGPTSSPGVRTTARRGVIWSSDSLAPVPPVASVPPSPPIALGSLPPVADVAPPPPVAQGQGVSRSAPEARAEGTVAGQSVESIEVVPARRYGTLQLGVRCSYCSYVGMGARPRWEFSDYPEVYQLEEGGPAARAGIQVGDIITHVNGLDLKTPEGGERFGSLIAGERVEITYVRNGETRTVATFVAARRD